MDAKPSKSEPRVMKALTLTQPWASLVALGVKSIETRSWATNYRGPIAIHAAKGHPFKRGERFNIGAFEVECAQNGAGLLLRGDSLSWPYRLPLGCIVATCHLAHVMPTWDGDNTAEPPPVLFGSIWSDDDDERRQLERDGWWMDAGLPVAHKGQKPYGDFSPGRYAWFLENVQAVKPVEAKGALGLWKWEVNVDAVA